MTEFIALADGDLRALDRVAAHMYQVSADHGFHEGEDIGPDSVTTERMGIFCANLHGEVSELWEACRMGILHDDCNKGIHASNAEEELADIVIRAMDTAHTLGISLGDAIAKKTKYNEGRPYILSQTQTRHRPDTDQSSDPDLSCPAGRPAGRGRKAGPVLSEAFQGFWAAYPRKVGKIKAWKAWPGDSLLPKILEALAWQTKSVDWTKDRGTFIPHPATYLNQGRWEDEPAKQPNWRELL